MCPLDEPRTSMFIICMPPLRLSLHCLLLIFLKHPPASSQYVGPGKLGIPILDNEICSCMYASILSYPQRFVCYLVMLIVMPRTSH
jgi:hypothetical protein